MPSLRSVAVGWLANPVSYSTGYMKLPDASPVNGRPVRFDPCAPGASPMIRTRASGSPNPGTGLPQYSQSRYARRFSRATCSRYSTSRGHRVHATTSLFRIVSHVGMIRECDLVSTKNYFDLRSLHGVSTV